MLASRATTPCIGSKLLVEKIAQPRQFFGVAKIGRGNLFVELGGEDLIAPGLLMGEWRLRARLGRMASSASSASLRSSAWSAADFRIGILAFLAVGPR